MIPYSSAFDYIHLFYFIHLLLVIYLTMFNITPQELEEAREFFLPPTTLASTSAPPGARGIGSSRPPAVLSLRSTPPPAASWPPVRGPLPRLQLAARAMLRAALRCAAHLRPAERAGLYAGGSPSCLNGHGLLEHFLPAK